MRLLNNFGFDEEAVSPVVGVILMVAITVILAAVIGTFVLDLGGQVQQNAQAGVTFDETEGVDVQVQLNSVQNADHIYIEASTGAEADWDADGGIAQTDVQYQDGPKTSTGNNHGDQYLLSSTDTDEFGGVGTTVILNTDDSSGTIINAGQLTVIGVINGEENIIQTYQYAGGT